MKVTLSQVLYSCSTFKSVGLQFSFCLLFPTHYLIFVSPTPLPRCLQSCAVQRDGVAGEWAKAGWGRKKKKIVGLQEWRCNQVSISVSASLGFCVCVCVLVLEKELHGFWITAAKPECQSVSTHLFPFSAITLSTYSKSLAFYSLSSELRLSHRSTGVFLSTSCSSVFNQQSRLWGRTSRDIQS